MKILILILACKIPEYLRLESVIDRTWNSLSFPEITLYYYYGNNKKKYHDNRNIYLNSKEEIGEVAIRTIECFEYCLENFEFDYIFRTNLSSYINKELLYSFVKKNIPVSAYAGYIGAHNGIGFASGSGMLISKDNIQYLINNKKNIDYNNIDDVAIGKCLSKHIRITPIDRYDFNCSTVLPDQHIIKNIYHFRCKCPVNRINDEIIMYKIHNHILNKIE